MGLVKRPTWGWAYPVALWIDKSLEDGSALALRGLPVRP